MLASRKVGGSFSVKGLSLQATLFKSINTKMTSTLGSVYSDDYVIEHATLHSGQSL